MLLSPSPHPRRSRWSGCGRGVLNVRGKPAWPAEISDGIQERVPRVTHKTTGFHGSIALDAATALSTLQIENEKLRAELEQKSKLIAQQAAELERRDTLLKEQEAELE